MTLHTLSDCKLPYCRCSGCGAELPSTSPVESYPTSHSEWMVVQCPKCQVVTPFRLEKSA